MTSLFRSSPKLAPRALGTALALSLAMSLVGCGGIDTNRSLDSVHQPVVERVNYTLDVATGPGGLSYPEQSRLAGWFDAMDLRYGDHIAIDDPLSSEATHNAVAALAARHGLLVGDDAPATPGSVSAGNARIVITRAKATVRGCPDWSANSDFNPNNGTSSNYGCAVNGNLAAMVADPEHLLKGATGNSNTVVMSSNKAISAYRTQTPTGAGGGVKQQTTKGD
ncbi:MAG: CpaD family pilus assembly protein [Sphingomonadales bacterium]|nr:CpaD family pilus assembly protein [Sphingomonadales bacterium]